MDLLSATLLAGIGGTLSTDLWALARPAGMMQGRGAMLAFWDDVLPALPDDLQAEHLRIVAESLASRGGRAFPLADRDGVIAPAPRIDARLDVRERGRGGKRRQQRRHAEHKSVRVCAHRSPFPHPT